MCEWQRQIVTKWCSTVNRNDLILNSLVHDINYVNLIIYKSFLPYIRKHYFWSKFSLSIIINKYYSLSIIIILSWNFQNVELQIEYYHLTDLED